MNTKMLILQIFVIISIFIFIPKITHASTLYVTPNQKNVKENFNLKVQLNTEGENVNAVSAFLSYPSDKLDVAWINYDNSAFSIEAESSYENGIIKISRGSFTGVNGEVNIATIGFRSKSAGSAIISFIDGSAVPRESDSSDSLNLANSRGGSYNISNISKPGQPATLGEAISIVNLRANNTKNAIFIATGITIVLFLILRKKNKKKRN